ncbi:putative carbon catabolite repressor protein 4-like protein 3 [Iris pallida]|uniref:Carbon catabolite repressor protein 4-like protein 3 n=1 Tax=Iris pallida TaxID=29817 RepID=A0AAX6I8X9_IRIPA|nr:putative carbon catabolite repressor protein 4-like protein 3 [Iris pallida]
MLLSRAHVLSDKWGGIPVVLAGDFNSTPDSAMYEFLSTSELNITAHDKRYISGQDRLQFSLYSLPRLLKCSWTSEELKNASGNPKCTLLKHPLELRSSYASVKGNVQTRCPYGEPVATTYHLKFVGTVDYLWYSTGLVPTRVLDTLPMATLKATGGLPSKEIGSDHLALVSEFMFAECREKHPQNPTEITVTEEREDNLIQS